ncbi:kinase-like protein [Xylaria cubensis]|nr:kinase-like protein [Xylaria cubensis]
MDPQESTESSSKEDEKPLLETSKLLGFPPYVLDPQDLEIKGFDLCPGRLGSSIRQIDEETVVKYGPNVSLVEAEAMDFISSHTSVKCPKVIGAYVLDGTAYIIMSYEPGKLLAEFWEDASDEDKEKVIEQLQRYLKEMRDIKGDYVGGFNRNPCVAGEFQWDYDWKSGYKYGPYPDECGFNEGIMDAISRAGPGSVSTDPESRGYNRMYATGQLVRSLREHEIVFTHGDLNAGNIIIRDDLTVVIIDWCTAGFYPAYWEWYKATWHGVFKPSFIRQVERYIPPYWIEANIMNQIFKLILG